ncbi:MAG: phospholipase D-like domain-containing protein, partial [Ferruginibacter sp.]
MHWNWIVIICYLAFLLLVCLRIIFETHSSTKTLAYLLFCTFVPVVGIVFYIAFGVNYWKIKRYSKKAAEDEKLLKQLKKNIPRYTASIITQENTSLKQNAELASMLIKDLKSPLSRHNKVKLLVNGEEKFPELLKCLAEAKHHIHMEYYIFEQDEIGCAVIEMLIKKAKEGVEVRFIYDDFGSPTIKKKIEKRMTEAGIEIYPFSKVKFYLLANRINYRNHRKIVIIDGHTAFTGGINISDKYINNKKG